MGTSRDCFVTIMKRKFMPEPFKATDSWNFIFLWISPARESARVRRPYNHPLDHTSQRKSRGLDSHNLRDLFPRHSRRLQQVIFPRPSCCCAPVYGDFKRPGRAATSPARTAIPVERRNEHINLCENAGIPLKERLTVEVYVVFYISVCNHSLVLLNLGMWWSKDTKKSITACTWDFH